MNVENKEIFLLKIENSCLLAHLQIEILGFLFDQIEI